MRFVLSNRAPQAHAKAYWFAYKDGRLGVHWRGPNICLPVAEDPARLGLQVGPARFIGFLDGLPCYTARVEEIAAEASLNFVGMRHLCSITSQQLFSVAGRALQMLSWQEDTAYCSRCGAPTEPVDGEPAKRCPACGLLSFPRICPAIIVAVTRESRILLAHARRFPPGMYSVLAGFVEPGESLEECARREIREEVGISVREISYFGSQPWPFPHSLMVAFTAIYAEGRLSVDECENTEAGWFSAAALPRVPGQGSIARELIDWFVFSRARGCTSRQRS